MSDAIGRAQSADANREWWSAVFSSHYTSDFYDVESFVANERAITLGSDDVQLLGDISDRSLLHLQCNFGLDTLSFRRLGARVTGTDLCTEAITAATSLAERCGLVARFLKWDANRDDLESLLNGERFDIVTVSYGALEWVENLDDYFAQASSVLRLGGGVLHVAEAHPVAKWILRRLGRPSINYGDTGVDDEVGASYANGMKFGAIRPHAHSLADILQGIARAGLRIIRFQENTTSSYRFHRNMIPVDGRWAWPKVGAGAPLVFSLLAVLDKSRGAEATVLAREIQATNSETLPKVIKISTVTDSS